MNNLLITGDIVKILDTQSGQSQAGKAWIKREFVINTGGSYAKDVCFQLFGEERVENITKYNKVGDRVTVSFNLSSKAWEKHGKSGYFHSLDAWRIEKVEGVSSDNPTVSVRDVIEAANTVSVDGDTDMPF